MRTVRAAIIAVFLVANLVLFVPYAKIKPEAVHDPEWRRGDIEAWHRRLDPVLPMDVDTFADLVRRGFWAAHETVRMLRLPFLWFFEVTHTTQQWGLFAIVTEAPDSLVIEVRRDKEWETLYRRLDGRYDWHDEQLKYRRIRGVWDGVKDEPKGTYKRMSTWIARTVFTEQPDVDRVRVVLEKRRVPLPWEEPDPTVTRRAERYHRREEMGL